MEVADVVQIETHKVSANPAAGGYLGTFTHTITNVSSGDGAGQVTWNFTVNNADLQFLSPSQRRHTSSLGEWSADLCSSDLQTVSITINGSEDAPSITAAVASGSVTE